MDFPPVYTHVDERGLQRHVVKIKDPDGKVLGTGFFAAPGRILTNAHVVRDLADVMITSGAARDEQEGPGKVVARSDAKQDRDDQPLWPFPDLAVISTEAFPGHPCVLIDSRVATSSDLSRGLRSWGYPQRAGEVNPDGDPATYTIVGRGTIGEPYYRILGDWVGHGMSGAPVVSVDRGAVVGVVAATLNLGSTAGGWFTPLLEVPSHPGINPELNEEVTSIIANSSAAVATSPSRWSDVVTLAGVEQVCLVRQSASGFRRGPHTSPAELLLANNRIVAYQFYDEEISQVLKWAWAADPVRMALIAGSGGSGKTRFALELAKRLNAHGWVTVELSDLDAETARTISLAPVPRLIVVDYAENRASEVETLLRRLVVSATPATPARVLLLSREAISSPGSASRPSATLPYSNHSGVNRVLGERLEMGAATRTLSLADRRTLYESAMPLLADAWDASVRLTRRAVDLSDAQYGTALAVIYEALDTVLAGEAPTTNPPANPADRILSHEARYWSLIAPAQATTDQLAQTVALATLFAGSMPEHLVSPICHLGVDPALALALAAWAAELYGPGPDISPLRPDRLGERLIEQALVVPQGVPRLNTFLDVANDAQWARGIETLSRAAAYSDAMRQTLVTTMRRITPALTRRATDSPKSDPAAHALAVALIDLFSGPYSAEIIGPTGSPVNA